MKPKSVGAYEAKARLSYLLSRVEKGQVFRITRRGHPIAELRPLAQAPTRLQFGVDRGRVHISQDFDAPLPEFSDYEDR
jgi:prevent-host-death family protein